MTEKTVIVEELGERPLLLPATLEHALEANDHVKYLFTLLQTARDHAEDPRQQPPDLSAEAQRVGHSRAQLRETVEGSRRREDGSYEIPRFGELFGQMVDDVERMIEPLRFDGDARSEVYQQRLQALTKDHADDDRVANTAIAEITRARREAGDSLHLLVMDLHRELNRLQADIAQESINGARVYGITEDDRSLIQAFMEGVNSTAPLKFDHPGLATTATRSGSRLLIQNDIGTTDAHILLVEIEALTSKVSYTDVHPPRAAFFRDLLSPWKVVWQDTSSRHSQRLSEPDFVLCIGTLTARDRSLLNEYLRFLGSRLVFLIDWNRARKRLRPFIKKSDTIDLLKWAADHDYGHRAFLELGGERLLHEAIEQAAPAPIRYGQRLDELLDRETVRELLRTVLRLTSEGLREGRSQRLIRDQIKAEFLEQFHSLQDGLFSLVSRHASYVVELAGGARDVLLRAGVDPADPFLPRTAQRAKSWETRADEVLMRARELVKHSPGSDFFERLISSADDIADGLEEVLFLATLLPEVEHTEALFPPLQRLASLVLEGAQEYLKCVESAADVRRRGSRDDIKDFLEAVDRVAELEHSTDEAERRVMASLIPSAADFRQLHVLSQMARSLEESADGLASSALRLRDHILEELAIR